MKPLFHYQGTTLVTVTNAWGNHALCTFSIFEGSGSRGNGYCQ